MKKLSTLVGTLRTILSACHSAKTHDMKISNDIFCEFMLINILLRYFWGFGVFVGCYLGFFSNSYRLMMTCRVPSLRFIFMRILISLFLY